MELGCAEPPEHCEESGDVGRVVVVAERVPGVGVCLDVVVDSHRGEDPIESLRGSPIGAILCAVAADDGAGAGQKALRVDVLGGHAAVHARGGEPAIGSEHQGEPATHAEANHANAARAVLAGGQPGAHGFDIVECGPVPPPGITHDLAYAGKSPAPAVQVRRSRETVPYTYL